jgi:DNA-binding transcriptional ArsR family regulator
VSDRVAEALFGKTRRNVLSLLFGRPDERFYMRQVARMTGASVAAVQHELARLTTAQLVARTPEGKQVYYRANTESPVFNEIRGLMDKTVGAVAVVRSTLSGLAGEGRIDIAFIYGSVASGTYDAFSDVDVMIIGEIKLSEIIPALRVAQDRLGREINPTIYPGEELRMRLTDREHFVTQVMDGPKIILIGSENDLERLAAEPLAG